MSSQAEVLHNRTISGEEPLSVPGRLEALHASFQLAGGLMGIFRPIVEVPALSMFHPRQNISLRGPIACQLIGHDDSRDVPTAFEQFTKEFLGGCFVAPTLH